MTDEHDLGLGHDLPRIIERNRIGRRGLFGIGAGVGLVALAGCGDDSTTTSGSDPGSSRPSPPEGGGPGGAGSTVAVAEGEIPEETAGPYPGDGSNGPNVLTESGVVRSDITSSFGSASGVAEGVPTTVRLRILDLDGDDATPLVGAAVYLWHCDREGRYSMYSDGVTEENYLRGVQEADDDGRLEFTTIFPATYSGRWPHMHFEVYESLDAATARIGEAPHLTARHPRGRRERGLRDRRRLRDQHRDPVAGQPGQRHGVLRRLLAADGQGDRVGGGGLHRLADGAGLTAQPPGGPCQAPRELTHLSQPAHPPHGHRQWQEIAPFRADSR